MAEREPATAVGLEAKKTEVGSVFVSNYPPYSFWDRQHRELALQATQQPSDGRPLGMYLHIPFCRKRCKFCYFRVFTEKNSQDVERYLDAMGQEMATYAARPIAQGRSLQFIYFGGGTPSFISARHLRQLVGRMRDAFSWDGVEEVTFECEPGTLTRPKLETIRELGITRISLGVENFNDRILEENGRAHKSKEIYRVEPWIRDLNFDQVNIDLIAGMVGETEETWHECVERALRMRPDSITIYQMELPFNTVYSRQVLGGSGPAVADWATKRAWHDYAIDRLAESGYEVSSAYTMVRKDKPARFVYRNSVWRGCDLMSVGVSSFGHLAGVHYQNLSGWDDYLKAVESGSLPIDRGLAPTPDERLTRELILQLKLGRIEPVYFQDKFNVDITKEFAAAFSRLESRGMLQLGQGQIELTRKGLLQVDSLLPEFYAEKYQNARYT